MWNWNNKPKDCKVLLFDEDNDESSDLASPSRSLIMLQYSAPSSYLSSSEGPCGMRNLQVIYDEIEELSKIFNVLLFFFFFYLFVMP